MIRTAVLKRRSLDALGAGTFGLAALLVLAPAATAQSNIIPGTDVSLGQLGDIDAVGREGTFPNGMNGAAMSTTSCNVGSVQVPWFSPMNEDHPFIAFIVTREDDSGRIYQISDRSYLKHGFFALASNECNLGCNPPSQFGDYLGVGCSDTYGISNNSDKFYLGPPEEVDPWLGEWDAFCSYFDLGLNPGSCNGLRSFSQSQAASLGPVGTRINVSDQDLIDSGTNAQFAYQAYYVIRGEQESNRGNNLGWRDMTANWNGTKWNLDGSGSLNEGSILDSWDGATVTSATNGLTDGRVYAGVVVTTTRDGEWHYEYALHNRDNSRGVSEFRVPFCSAAPPSNFGFRDVDDDAGNDWTATVVGNELVFSAPAGNALEWNTIFNVWFDCPAAPESGAAVLVQDQPGAGPGQFSILTTVPTLAVLNDLGPGCSLSGTPPRLTLAGNDQFPSLGNSGFKLAVRDQAAGSFGYLFYSGTTSVTPIPPSCTAYLGGTFGIDIFTLGTAVSNPSGNSVYSLPIPNNPAFEGAELTLQSVVVNLGGPFAGIADLSNGARLRVGNAISGCF
ncbi:hypothetical protein Pla163_13640 [Planctomycetes bacterium Pla163]|uniref:Uncharacterized protein n=1 Tax=Rohdeia mirabilis TaxID=2528008 RepID=A0A518CYI5_9BACT|nr:hypothetical protein Pla163_13640 [Planctomycetes bacterium Pla163]